MRLVWTPDRAKLVRAPFCGKDSIAFAERFGRVRTRKCNKDVPRAFNKADVDDVAEENNHEV
jgi:hypothetical protein